MKNKTTKAPIHLCKTCGKSSYAGSKCAYEETEKMASCPTFIRMKVKKEK